MVALGPVFIGSFSRAPLKGRIRVNLLVALAVANLGAVLLSIPEPSSPQSSIIEVFEIVMIAFLYAIFAVLSKPLVAKYGALPVAIRAGTIETAMLLPLLSASFFSQVSKLPPIGWFSVICLSILGTVVGYSMFYALVSRGIVSRLQYSYT